MELFPADNEQLRKISSKPEISRGDVLSLCVHRQAAAVGVFLRFLGLGVLGF
jgi:hypothetical protein